MKFAEWRHADQRYYVSDTGKFQTATGWRPRVGVREGVERLYRWLLESRGLSSPQVLAERREEHTRPALGQLAGI